MHDMVDRPAAGHNILPRNTGIALDLDWVNRVRCNLPAAERRVASLPGRRTVCGSGRHQEMPAASHALAYSPVQMSSAV